MHNSLSDESQIEVGEGHWIIGGQGGGIAWTMYLFSYPGAAEQVKPVKHVLHRNSEVLLQRNF